MSGNVIWEKIREGNEQKGKNLIKGKIIVKFKLKGSNTRIHEGDAIKSSLRSVRGVKIGKIARGKILCSEGKGGKGHGLRRDVWTSGLGVKAGQEQKNFLVCQYPCSGK